VKAPAGIHRNQPPERTGLLGGFAARLQEGFGFLGQSYAQRLAAIVESSDDAIISLDLDGHIATWNAGAERLLGYAAEDIIGEQITMLVPHDREGEEQDILARIKRGERIDHYRTLRRRKDGSLVPVSLTVSPIGDSSGAIIGASKIARDMTEQERTHRSLSRRMAEQAALYEFTDRLFRAQKFEDIHEAALDAIISALGCDRASILMFDSSGVMKFVAWRGLSNGYRIAVEGHSPWTRQTRDPAPILTADIDATDLDPALKATIKAEGIAALAFIPLTVGGELAGKFMTYYNAPQEFTANDTELAVTIARQLGFSIERRRAEEAKALLLAETQHRIKNTLATVHAIAAQTLREAPPGAVESFLARLHALGEAHDLLTIDRWEKAPLREVVARALQPFGERITLSGPPVCLPAQTSLMLTMCLHELATNAVKYGALSKDSGKVGVDWEVNGNGGQLRVRLAWQETGGPPVTAPARKGFGSRLIERSFKSEGAMQLQFNPDGVRCVLDLPPG
jgi:PAS domain S-box-containing protein